MNLSQGIDKSDKLLSQRYETRGCFPTLATMKYPASYSRKLVANTKY